MAVFNLNPFRYDFSRFITPSLETNFKSMIAFAAIVTFAGFLGNLAGGMAGLYLSLGFTLISTAFIVYYSREIVLRLFGAREVLEHEWIEGFDLYEMVNHLKNLEKINLKVTPKVCIIESDELNAFATGRHKEHAAVVITTGLLKKALMSANNDYAQAARWIEAIWCHELGHLVHYDVATNAVASIFAATVKLLSHKLHDLRREERIQADNKNKNKSEDQQQAPKNTLGRSIAEYVLFYMAIPFVTTLLALSLSRTREFAADDMAAECGRAKDLAGALALLLDHSHRKNASPQMEAFSSLMCLNLDHQHDEKIANRLKEKNIGWLEWFEVKAKELYSTHPPLRQRIERMNAYAEKQHSPRPM